MDILTHVLVGMGCRYSLHEMPLKRSLSAVEHGTIDVVMGASRSPERERYALFSSPYRREVMVMFMRKGEAAGFKPLLLSDISRTRLKIGVLMGSWYGGEFNHLVRQDPAFRGHVLQLASNAALFKGLKYRRVDIALVDLFTGVDHLRRTGELDTVDVHPRPVNDDVTYFMFSRKSVPQSLVDRVNEQLKAYEKSDAFAKTTRKYVPDAFLHYLPVQKALPATQPSGNGKTRSLLAP